MNIEKHTTNKYVAYLDVLGFKELVSGNKTKDLQTYFDTVQNTLVAIKNDKQNIESLLISDSTILIAKDNEHEFKLLLTAIQTIQAKLALKNIFMRGAVTFGEVFYNRPANLVVGKALVNAYLQESKAIYPRVTIDPAIISKIASNRSEFFERVNTSSSPSSANRRHLVHTRFEHINEDAFFVAYGHRIILDAVSNRTLDVIYNIIKKNLYSIAAQYEKYLWVKKYFLDVFEQLYTTWPPGSNDAQKKDASYLVNYWEKFKQL